LLLVLQQQGLCGWGRCEHRVVCLDCCMHHWLLLLLLLLLQVLALRRLTSSDSC
jgi:hypothetical protein